MNNIVHRELRRAFEKITIVADEIGSNEYMQSFCKYVASKQDMPSLFGDADFCFNNSKNDVRIQIADFISGTLVYMYDTNKRLNCDCDYLKILNNKIIRIEPYPKTYDTYILETSAIAEDYDEDIAKLCFAQAVKFIESNTGTDDSETSAQIIVLQYLLFRFMNNDTRGYIYTEELKKQLANTELGRINLNFSFLHELHYHYKKHISVLQSSKINPCQKRCIHKSGSIFFGLRALIISAFYFRLFL